MMQTLSLTHDLNTETGRHEALSEALSTGDSLRQLRATVLRSAMSLVQSHIYTSNMRSLQLQLIYVERVTSQEALDQLIELYASIMAPLLTVEETELLLQMLMDPRALQMAQVQQRTQLALGEAMQQLDFEVCADINAHHSDDPLDVEGSMAKAKAFMEELGLSMELLQADRMRYADHRPHLLEEDEDGDGEGEDHEDHEDDDARSDEWLAGFQAAIDTVAAHSVIFAREDHSVIFALNLLKAALADPARAEAALEGIAALGLANPTSGMTP